MKANLVSPPLDGSQDIKDTIAAMKRTIARAKKDPSYGLRLLVATGMHDKNGRLKKQFR